MKIIQILSFAHTFINVARWQYLRKKTTRQILSIPSKKKKNIKYSLNQEEIKMTHKNEKYLQKEKIECFYMENT